MSAPEPPERAGLAAFTELESVVRNVTEQLAGFRRRALAAEARVREAELELARAEQETVRVAALQRELAEAESQAGLVAPLQRDLAAAEARAGRVTELEQALAAAVAAVDDATKQAADVAARDAAVKAEWSKRPATSELALPLESADVSTLQAENGLLRERLADANERTRLIGERVRFLRQQLSNGGEK